MRGRLIYTEVMSPVNSLLLL